MPRHPRGVGHSTIPKGKAGSFQYKLQPLHKSRADLLPDALSLNFLFVSSSCLISRLRRAAYIGHETSKIATGKGVLCPLWTHFTLSQESWAMCSWRGLRVCRAPEAYPWFADPRSPAEDESLSCTLEFWVFKGCGTTPQTTEQTTLDSAWREQRTPREDEKVMSKPGRAGGEIWESLAHSAYVYWIRHLGTSMQWCDSDIIFLTDQQNLKQSNDLFLLQLPFWPECLV